MARKSRRVRKKGQPVHLSPTQMVQPGAGEAMDISFGAGSARTASKEVDLQEEYRYVIADLKRIGVIAVLMLAVLITLALLSI